MAKAKTKTTAQRRGTKGKRGAADGSTAINVAGMHKDEFWDAIEKASPADLEEIDAQCEAQGWDANGVARTRIAVELCDDIGTLDQLAERVSGWRQDSPFVQTLNTRIAARRADLEG